MVALVVDEPGRLGVRLPKAAPEDYAADAADVPSLFKDRDCLLVPVVSCHRHSFLVRPRFLGSGARASRPRR